MKRVFYLLFGAAVGIALGTLLAIPFNHWYAENFVRGDDDANFLVSVLFFVWPVSAFFGAVFGNFLWRKHIEKID
ncbi:MAG: hypothetical protein LBE78_09445 [Burkholderiaceae bacterium]|jgi:hypothetical protein|nr:hypothetical protein [Burkholderiaceae bacterium]